MSDNKKQDVTQALKGFRAGDQIMAAIVSIDRAKGRVNFGIKASYFKEEFGDEEDGATDEKMREMDEDSVTGDKKEYDMPMGDEDAEAEDEGEDEDEDEDDDKEDEVGDEKQLDDKVEGASGSEEEEEDDDDEDDDLRVSHLPRR